MGQFTKYPLARRDWVLAGLLMLAALACRGPFILRGETLLHSDEAVVGIMAQDIAEGRRWPIYFYGQAYMGAVEAYVMAGLLRIGVEPLIALRLAPALFFALLVGLQYLMLTRWFDRGGGLLGAGTLILCSPMFMQWTIAPRGGYIEALVWGSAILWAYGEWFADREGSPPRLANGEPSPGRSGESKRHQFLFGLLVSSGLWINPLTAMYLPPMVIHALLGHQTQTPKVRRWLDRLGVAALPVLVFLLYFALTSLYGMWADDVGIHRIALLGILPWPISGVVSAGVVLGLGIWALWRTRLLEAIRHLIRSGGPMILGCLVGYLPAALYVLQRFWSQMPRDDSLPIGLRPIWTIGPSLNFLYHGLPVLFGADPTGFLHLVQIGRVANTIPLGTGMASLLAVLNWLVLAVLLGLGLALIMFRRQEFADLFKLKPGSRSPAALLLLTFLGMLAMFTLNGCTFDFHNIRYLFPICTIFPGLIAAAVSTGWQMEDPPPEKAIGGPAESGVPPQKPPANHAHQTILNASVLILLVCWGIGQYGLWRQLGPPHELKAVAEQLRQVPLPLIKAESLDAQILSFYTRQHPPVAEFKPYWPRLKEYRHLPDFDSCRTYVVQTGTHDWETVWRNYGFPGIGIEDMGRFLRPDMFERLRQHPQGLLSSVPLAPGFEMWTLDAPLKETDPRTPGGLAPAP